MDIYDFFEKVNNDEIAQLDILHYIEVRTDNNTDKLKTLLNDLEHFHTKRVTEITFGTLFNGKSDKKEPQKSLDKLKEILEQKIETERKSQNKLTSIPKVSTFSNSINNTMFNKVLLKTLDNNSPNNIYYKNVFNNWVKARTAHLENTPLADQAKWIHNFLNIFCSQLIDNTIQIARGAHHYHKGLPKYNKDFEPGYFKLFHLLNYGDGYTNTIEIYLQSLRLKRAENPALALSMRDYYIDRIKELKTMLEINFFFKKVNPIYFHFDQIILEFKNNIDPEIEKIKSLPSIHKDPEENIEYNRHSKIFTRDGFKVWSRMFIDFNINASSRTDLRFMFDTMKKEEIGLIHSTVSQKALLDWINEVYELTVEKLPYRDFKNDTKRQAIFKKAIADI